MSVSIAGSQLFAGTNTGAYTVVGTGNLFIVFFYETTPGASNLTISDTKSNLWHQAAQVFNGAANNNASVWWCLANGTGSTTITCNDNLGTLDSPGFMVIEYHNTLGWPSNPQDAVATAKGQDFPVTNSVTRPTLNTTQTDIIVSFIVDTSGSITLLAGTGYVMEITDSGQYAGLQDQLGAGGVGRPAGSYTPGAVALQFNDSIWVSIMAGFILASAPPPATSKTNIFRSGHGSRLIPPYGPGGHQ